MSRIDPSIALGVKTPQQNDTLETYGRVLQMRNLLDAGKINKQNMEMNDENLKRAGLENQARERAEKGLEIRNDAIRNNTNLNEDGTVHVNHDMVEAIMTRYGYPDLAKAYNADRSTVEENEHKRIMNQLDEHAKKVKQLGQMSQSILNASPDLRPGLYAFALKQAQSAGLLSPEDMQQIPPQYDGEKTEAMLQEMSDHATENPAEAMLKRMQEKRAAETQAAELSGKKAESMAKQIGLESTVLGAATDQASWEKALAQLPEDRRRQYTSTYTKEAGHQAALMGLTAEQRAKINEVSNINELALQAAKGDKDAQKALDILKRREIDINQAKQYGGLESLGTGPGGGPALLPNGGPPDEEFLKTIPPGAQATVKGLVDYTIPLPGGMALRSPYWQTLLGLAKQYDSSFDVKEYASRQKLATSFKAGADADNIKSINTAISHLGRLMTSAKALNNYAEGDIGPLTTIGNLIKNAVKNQSGSEIIKKFKIDRSAVKGELVKAYRGTSGSADDIKDWENNFSDDSSSNALQGGGQETIKLLAGRLEAIKDKYSKGMGKGYGGILTPESRKIIQSLGIDPNTIEPETATPNPTNKVDVPKIITQELMAKARAANPKATDEQLRQGFEARGYVRP